MYKSGKLIPLALSLAAIALGQAAFGTAAFGEDQAIPPADAPPGQQQPSGPLAKVGSALHDHGIDLGLSYINIYQNASDFGFTKGKSANYGIFLFDATAHLSDTFKIKIQESINYPTYNVDNYLFNLSNSFFPVPVVDSDTDLTRLTIEGDFFNDKLEIEAGRMGLSQDFLKMQGFCGGLGCLNSTSALTLDIPGAALSEWGGRAAYKMSPNTQVGFGIIEDNPDNWQSGDGWDWGKGSAKGYIAVANVFHDETFRDNRNPLRYEVGAYHSSTPYDDALYNSGWGNPTYTSASRKIVTHDDGSTGVYGQFRKVVWADPLGGPMPENLAVYGGLFHTFGEGQAYPWEAYAGLEYSGFWDRNPMAGIGATVHYIGLSKERAQYERNARRFFSGVDEAQPRDTFQFDVHGRVGVSQFGILELGAAYMVNPNTSVLADYSTGRQKDGVVLYATLVFDIGASLGLAPKRMP